MSKRETVKQLIRYRQIRDWYLKYERALIPATLVFGVIVDSVTFASIQVNTAFLLFAFHALVAGGTIIFLNAYDAKRVSHVSQLFRYFRLAAPLIIQFTFGALLSGTFIFYWFSGALSVSWPFIAIVVILMVSNDVFRHYYEHPVVQMSVYFFIIFSLTAIILPFVLHAIGVWVFAMSGVVSVLFMAAYFWAMQRAVPSLRSLRRHAVIAIAAVFVLMNGLYFLNVIPPIPLSIREATVAHEVLRVGGAYELTVEERAWWARVLPGRTVHWMPGERIYVYSAIFAPTELRVDIVHHWQWLNERSGEWESRSRLSFEMRGGREGGFRGYSLKQALQSGFWRVDVETERGQVLGRVQFELVEVDTPVATETIVK